MPAHLPPKMADASPPVTAAEAASTSDPRAKLLHEIEGLERARIVEALVKCANNQTQAAEMLGISRRTLVTRLGQYDLPRPRRRNS